MASTAAPNGATAGPDGPAAPAEERHSHQNYAEALAAFQAELPDVAKGTKGQVRGRSDYRYADIADLNGVVLPMLGKHGLSFSAKPTLNEQGRFVLAYVMRHECGQSDGGEYPLPDGGSAQDMGSAQTYARRYALQAMTGVAPDEDDDGASAPSYGDNNGGRQNGQQNGQQNRPAQPQRRQQEQPPAPPAQNGQDEPGTHETARSPIAVAQGVLAQTVERHGLKWSEVKTRYQEQFGEPLEQAVDANRILAFAKVVVAEPAGATP